MQVKVGKKIKEKSKINIESEITLTGTYFRLCFTHTLTQSLSISMETSTKIIQGKAGDFRHSFMNLAYIKL